MLYHGDPGLTMVLVTLAVFAILLAMELGAIIGIVLFYMIPLGVIRLAKWLLRSKRSRSGSLRAEPRRRHRSGTIRDRSVSRATAKAILNSRYARSDRSGEDP